MCQKAGWDEPGHSLGHAGSSQWLLAVVSPGCEPLRAGGAPDTAAGVRAWPGHLCQLPLPSWSSQPARMHTCDGVVVWASLQPGEDRLVDEALQVVECFLACLGVHAAGACRRGGQGRSPGSMAALLPRAASQSRDSGCSSSNLGHGWPREAPRMLPGSPRPSCPPSTSSTPATAGRSFNLPPPPAWGGSFFLAPWPGQAPLR